jgi:hypothetical protein
MYIHIYIYIYSVLPGLDEEISKMKRVRVQLQKKLDEEKKKQREVCKDTLYLILFSSIVLQLVCNLQSDQSVQSCSTSSTVHCAA